MSASMLCKTTAVLVVVVMVAVFSKTSAQTEVVAITGDDREEIVMAHNALRSIVNPTASNMQRMEYNEELADLALLIARRCIFQHSDSDERTDRTSFSSVGENLFASTELAQNYTDVVKVQWGLDEAQYYDFESNSCEAGQTCGHYTQIIWADSSLVGCGTVRCASLPGFVNRPATFIVCEYALAGNFIGRRPYTSGVSCSDCPSDKTMCRDDLCSPLTLTQPPATTEATTELPDTTEATTELPDTSEPTIQPPDTSEPSTQPPATTEATTELPDTSEPTTQPPDTTEPTSRPTTVATDRPVPDHFVVFLIGDSPVIEDDNTTATVTLMVEANGPVKSITCYMKGMAQQDCTEGVAVFSGVIMDADRTHYVRVKARSMDGEVYTIRRKIVISPPDVCTVHFVNGGVQEVDSGSVRIEFVGRGPSESFYCQMDRGEYVPCSYGDVFTGLFLGRHLVKVVPDPAICGRNRRTATLFFRLE